ncbi:hypothetical protein [Maribacter cobaltidurans]|uniref:Uncharacterized protein n=1 Tax=Maribacter cobaltidurans TaxID=1178778 RepID=A0A223V5X4_9FLAO|nr:hypothetical protein [Maribacter cobaltidurans]ASV30803.1 hypothetical protein CJ263_11570 [Maribacter cobaltidurans]GGD81880.1 hypothetical protein GCM10011412_19590 [Maribacter cobaltidurans]
MGGRIQEMKNTSYLVLKKDIETRLHFLTQWRNDINLKFENIIENNHIDEIKDMIIQIDDNINRNNKLKISLFLEENPDFDGFENQINSLMISSIDTLNESAEREFEIIHEAMLHLKSNTGKNLVKDLKKIA